jgi:hypothetical protein
MFVVNGQAEGPLIEANNGTCQSQSAVMRRAEFRVPYTRLTPTQATQSMYESSTLCQTESPCIGTVYRKTTQPGREFDYKPFDHLGPRTAR